MLLQHTFKIDNVHVDLYVMYADGVYTPQQLVEFTYELGKLYKTQILDINAWSKLGIVDMLMNQINWETKINKNEY